VSNFFDDIGNLIADTVGDVGQTIAPHMPDGIPANGRMSGHRADTWRLRVRLDGNSLGVWDKKTGGALDSDDNKYPPGGLGPPISLGGRRNTDNITLSRMYDSEVFDPVIQHMFNRTGKGKIDVAQIPLDVDGKEFGKAINVSGLLKRVTIPEVDNESSTAAMIEIEISISGYPHAA
jgi:hypothetical protein